MNADMAIGGRRIDLSRPMGKGGADKILSHESPEKWGVDVQRFMAT